MRRVVMGMLAGALALAGCESDNILVPVDGPAAPRNLDAYYYAGAVTVTRKGSWFHPGPSSHVTVTAPA